MTTPDPRRWASVRDVTAVVEGEGPEIEHCTACHAAAESDPFMEGLADVFEEAAAGAVEPRQVSSCAGLTPSSALSRE